MTISKENSTNESGKTPLIQTQNYTQTSFLEFSSPENPRFFSWTVNGRAFKIAKQDLLDTEASLKRKIAELKSLGELQEAEIMGKMDSEEIVTRIKISQDLFAKLKSVFLARQKFTQAESEFLGELQNPLLCLEGGVNPLKVLARAKLEKIQRSCLNLEYLRSVNSANEAEFEFELEVD